MTLRIRDTLSKRIVPVGHAPGRPVRMYVCGPTVYAPAHVGHARTYLYFDLIRRAFAADGIPVQHVMNITDFEEKIDARAALLGVTWRELARREERDFFRDLDAFGILRPTYRPRASDFISRMVRVATRLANTGRIRRDGDRFYYHPPERPRGANFPLGAELAEHAVIEPGHPFPTHDTSAGEFLVWQLQKPPLPSWKGPWGPGMPGWHLECFAMAEEHLGVPVDLHGGGLDLIYPHHYSENEIALSLLHRPFARRFLHTAFVLQNGSKMSKSKGNLTTIRAAIAEADAPGLRWFLGEPSYTERVEWDVRRLRRATAEHARMRALVTAWLRSGVGGAVGAREATRLVQGVRRDLENNLRTGRAADRVREFVLRLESDGRGGLPRGERAKATAAIRELEFRLGVPFRGAAD